MRAKVTEQGVTIPKSLLPDVDAVDIRKRNGVVEVAPVPEDDHFSSSVSTHKPTVRHAADDSAGRDEHIVQTDLTLWNTYYNSGFFNIRVAFDKYVRSDEGSLTLTLGKSRRKIRAFVNRSANQNGTARIMGGAALKDWFQENHRQGEKVLMTFASLKEIVLGGALIVAPLKDTDPLYKLGSDPIPREELDIADASVNLDKYIYGE